MYTDVKSLSLFYSGDDFPVLVYSFCITTILVRFHIFSCGRCAAPPTPAPPGEGAPAGGIPHQKLSYQQATGPRECDSPLVITPRHAPCAVGFGKPDWLK